MSDIIDVVGILQFGTEVYDSVMIDTCRVSRDAPRREWVLDPETRKLVPPPDSVKYEGDCVLTNNLTKGEDTVLGRTVDANTYTIDLPLSYEDVEEGDLVVMVTCTMDPKVVGLALRVDGVVLESLAVARTVICTVDVPG